MIWLPEFSMKVRLYDRRRTLGAKSSRGICCPLRSIQFNFDELQYSKRDLRSVVDNHRLCMSQEDGHFVVHIITDNVSSSSFNKKTKL